MHFHASGGLLTKAEAMRVPATKARVAPPSSLWAGVGEALCGEGLAHLQDAQGRHPHVGVRVPQQLLDEVLVHPAGRACARAWYVFVWYVFAWHVFAWYVYLWGEH